MYNFITFSNLTKRGVLRVVESYRKMSNLKDDSLIGIIEASIRTKLIKAFNPQHLDVLNESYMHNVPKGAETHFKVVVVSDKFNDQTLITRSRCVHEVLQEELKSVHALSLVTKTPAQWDASDKKVDPSPSCRGGFGK